jgi:protease I
VKALILSADRFEDSELRVPCERLRAEGIEVVIASMGMGTITGKHGYQVAVNKTLRQIDADDYDLLLVPGGNAPAVLRKEKEAVQIVKSFFEQKKPVAAICHGPQVLVAAGVMSNRRATCYRSVAREIQDAGAIYEDREVVVDGNLITARQPSDLDAFMREIMKALRKFSEQRGFRR